MASSLAQQLTSIRSLNVDRIGSSSALTSHASYLFPPRTAAQQDTHTVHALGTNGWEELCTQDSSLARWDGGELLFGEGSRDLDRVQLGKEENARIDEAVREFLRRVGGVLLGKSAAKCLEWLVRRFRIQAFTLEDVLGAFMPYHETPQFARMLQICKLE